METEGTLLCTQCLVERLRHILRTTDEGGNRLVVQTRQNRIKVRTAHGVVDLQVLCQRVLARERRRQRVGVLSLRRVHLQLLVLAVSGIQMQLAERTLLADRQHIFHALEMRVVRNHDRHVHRVLRLLLRRKSLDRPQHVEKVRRYAAEARAASDHHHVLLVRATQHLLRLLHSLLLDDRLVAGSLHHRVGTLDEGAEILLVAQQRQLVRPAALAADHLDEEADDVAVVVGDGDGMVLHALGLRNADVRDGAHEEGELAALAERAHGDFEVHHVLIRVDLRDAAAARVDGDPAHQLVDDVESQREEGGEDEVSRVEVEEHEEHDHHHLVQVEEELPRLATTPRHRRQHHQRPQRHRLEEQVRGAHEVQLLPVDRVRRVVEHVADDSLEGGEALRHHPLANDHEHVEEGQVEGGRAHRAVRGDERGLAVRSEIQTHVGNLVDVLEHRVTGAEDDLR